MEEKTKFPRYTNKHLVDSAEIFQA